MGVELRDRRLMALDVATPKDVGVDGLEHHIRLDGRSKQNRLTALVVTTSCDCPDLSSVVSIPPRERL